MTTSDGSVIGSRAWAANRRGALTVREQLELARQMVLAQIAGLPSQARAWLGRGGGGRGALAIRREPPDSRLCRAALELATDASPSALLGHCLRCWLWADLFAQRDSVGHDPELLYVACLLHDVGLTDTYHPDPVDGPSCFAVHGGETAYTLLLAQGAADAFAEQVGDAIALHMNVRVPRRLGGEAHLLHAAAHLDVVGTRAGDLPAQARWAVVTAHPRDGFSGLFAQLMQREARERRRSRAALMWRLGMAVPLRHNPLDHT
jgi:hypothetical protein